jgi:saccharopine dehydrogenase-like NADP-dependent oxidoreductase
VLRILQLGVGLVGEVTARTAAGEPEVSAVALADIDEKRTTEIAKKLPAGKVETLTLDASDRNALFRALNGVDFVIDGLALVHRSN